MSIMTFTAGLTLVRSLVVLGLLYLFFLMVSAPVVPETLTGWKGGGTDFALVATGYLFNFILKLLRFPFLFVLLFHMLIQILLLAVRAVT